MTNYLNILSELDESPEKLYKRHTGFTVHSNDNDDSSDDDTKQSALKDLAKYKPPPYTFQELKYDFLSETDSDGDVPISENKDQKDDSLGGWVSIGELRRKSDSNAENDVVIKTKKKRSRKKKPAIEVTSTEPVVPSCETICQKLKELLTNDKCFICHKEGGRKHYRKTGHYKNVKLWLDSQCKGYFDQKLLFCEVCNQPLNGTLESMAHYQEDEHKINVESFCTICVRSMDPADLKRHYEMKHPELSKLNTNKSPSASTLSLTASSLGEQSEDSGSRKTKRKRYRKESSLVEDIVTEMTGNDFVEIVNSLADDEHFCSFCNKIGKRSSHFKTKSHYERVIELLNLSPEVFRPIPHKQFMCLPCLYVFRGGDSISEHFKDPIHKIESQYFCPQCLVHDNSLVHRQHKNWWSEAQVHFEMKGRLLDIEMKKYENFVQVPEQGKSVIEVTTPKTKVPQYIDSLHRPKPVRSPSPYPGLSNGDRWIRLTPVNDPLSPRDSPSQTKFPSVDKPKGEQSGDSVSRKTKNKSSGTKSSTVGNVVTEMSPKDFEKLVQNLANSPADRFCLFCARSVKSLTHLKKKSHYEQIINVLNLSLEILCSEPNRKFMCLPCHEILRGDLVSQHFKDPIHDIQSQYFCPQCLVHDNSYVHQQHKYWWNKAQLCFELKEPVRNVDMKTYVDFVQVLNRGESDVRVKVPKTKVCQNIQSGFLDLEQWPSLPQPKQDFHWPK